MRIGWELSWILGYEFVVRAGCTLYLSGCERWRWRLSRSGSRLRAFLNFRFWICYTWVVLRDGEEGCDVVQSTGWEDKQGGASGWGSVCNAKFCYIKEKKAIESLGAFFLPHPGSTFPLIKPLNRRWRGRIETVQVRKEHEGFKKISKRRNRGLKLILASRCYHAIALLSG